MLVFCIHSVNCKLCILPSYFCYDHRQTSPLIQMNNWQSCSHCCWFLHRYFTQTSIATLVFQSTHVQMKCFHVCLMVNSCIRRVTFRVSEWNTASWSAHSHTRIEIIRYVQTSVWPSQLFSTHRGVGSESQVLSFTLSYTLVLLRLTRGTLHTGQVSKVKR